MAENTLPEPILRNEKYLNAIAQNTASGGGGGKVVLAEKTITENGTYNAIDDEADGYNIVTVDVAGTITPADEGKVVYNGALVSQTSTTVSTEGTYDTTLNNEVVVDLPDKDGVTLILYDSNDDRVSFILYIVTNDNPSLKYGVGIIAPSNSAYGLPNTSGSLYTHIPLSTYFTGNINIELDGNSRTTTSRYTTILTIDVTNNRIDYTQSSDYSNVQAAWVGGTATNKVHNI